MRSMHSNEGIEDMVCELEGYRWNAILMSEMWRPDKSEIWDTPRHTTNTYSRVQENIATDTELELC